MNKNLKAILIVLGIGLAAYAVYAIVKAIYNGEKGIANILMTPFTALSDAWSAVTGWFGDLFSGSSSLTPGVTDAKRPGSSD